MLPRYKIILIIGIVAVGILWYVFFGGRVVPVKNYPLYGDTIVAFGDSLVTGVGSTREGGFVAILSQRLQKPIFNLGVVGDTTQDALARLPDVLREKPDVVIILLGGNDAIQRVPLETTMQNLKTIITTLQEHGAAVVLLGVQGALIRDRFDSDFRALAKAEGAVYVPNILEDIYRNPPLMYDGIHPNDEGYRMVADRVYPAVSGLLRGTCCD